MSNTIKFRRGLEGSLPTLADGEPAWCTDNFKLYVGSGGVNRFIGGVSDHGALSGLADDDHPQYLLASGARALTADWNAGAFTVTAGKFIATTTGTPPTVTAGNLHLYGSATVILNLEASAPALGATFGQIDFYNFDTARYVGARITAYNDAGANDGALRFYTNATGATDPTASLYLRMEISSNGVLEWYDTLGALRFQMNQNGYCGWGNPAALSDDLFNIEFAPTDDSAANLLNMTWTPTAVATGTYNNYCINIVPQLTVDAACVKAGTWAAAVIDGRASVAGFAGQVASLNTVFFYAGLTSGITATGNVSGNVTNVSLRSWWGAGTISGNVYDLYINAPVTGGTLTGTYWPIYVVGAQFSYMAGGLAIGVTAKSSKQTYGIILNQASSFDEILVLQSATDLGHSMSDYADADTYGHFLKVADAPGGLKIRGFTDSDGTALEIDGFIGTATPTATIPAIKLVAAKYNGATGVQALAATETALQLSTNGTNLITIMGNGHAKINSGTATAYPPTLTLKGGPGTGANEGPSLWLEHGYAAEDWKNGCIWTAGSGYGVNYASTMYFGVNFGSTASDVQQVFNITGTTAACYINLGANDSVLGIIRLYGNGVGSTYGGVAALYTAADYDGTIDYFGISVIEDDLWIGPDTNGNMVTLTAQSVLQLDDGVTEQFYKALGTDHTASGISENFTAGEALVFGDVCYFKSDGKMWKADADAATTMPVKAMTLASISADASGKFLLFGWVRDDTWAWTVGGLIYASVTGGALSQTAPSSSGDQVQVVGWAYSADIMFFNPNYSMVELV